MAKTKIEVSKLLYRDAREFYDADLVRMSSTKSTTLVNVECRSTLHQVVTFWVGDDLPKTFRLETSLS